MKKLLMPILLALLVLLCAGCRETGEGPEISCAASSEIGGQNTPGPTPTLAPTPGAVLSGKTASSEPIQTESREPEEMKRKIKLSAEGQDIIFELNDSPAAASLYEQLPFEVDVSNYSSNEKIFYPPQALDTTGAVPADAKAGTLAYFSPWGDVVMYYEDFGSYSGLYELGEAVQGAEYIRSIPEGRYTFEQFSDE